MGIDLRFGDCLELMQYIPNQSIDMILTDPPYGTTQCKWDSIIPLNQMWTQLKRIIKPNGAVVMIASQPFTSLLGSSNIKNLKYSWVWQKNTATGFLNAKRMPMKNHEDILVFYKKPPTYIPQGIILFNKMVRKGGVTGIVMVNQKMNFSKKIVTILELYKYSQKIKINYTQHKNLLR